MNIFSSIASPFTLMLLFLTSAIHAEPLPVLFREAVPVHLSLRGDFKKIHSDREQEYWSPAELGDLQTNRVFTGRIRARGNSSGREGQGTFPKILMEIGEDESLDGTLFKKNRKFRINTHVNTHPASEYTEMGRLNSELSAWREALAYELAAVVGLTAPGIRRATIDYTELTTNNAFTRMALLLETDGNMEKRLGVKVVSLEEFSKEKQTRISPDDSAMIHLFMVLIGNEDYVLRTSAEPPSQKGPDYDYGNVIVFQRADGTRFVGPYDFDRSTFVAGEGFLYYSRNAPVTLEGHMDLFVERLKRRHPESSVKWAAARFVAQESALKEAVVKAAIDEAGRENAMGHVERFIDECEELLNKT